VTRVVRAMCTTSSAQNCRAVRDDLILSVCAPDLRPRIADGLVLVLLLFPLSVLSLLFLVALLFLGPALSRWARVGVVSVAIAPPGPSLDPGRWRRRRWGRGRHPRRGRRGRRGWRLRSALRGRLRTRLRSAQAVLRLPGTDRARWRRLDDGDQLRGAGAAGGNGTQRHADGCLSLPDRNRGSPSVHAQLGEWAEGSVRQLESDRRRRCLQDFCRLAQLHRPAPQVARGHGGRDQRGQPQSIRRQHAGKYGTCARRRGYGAGTAPARATRFFPCSLAWYSAASAARSNPFQDWSSASSATPKLAVTDTSRPSPSQIRS
jgi:hypothetical protein